MFVVAAAWSQPSLFSFKVQQPWYPYPFLKGDGLPMNRAWSVVSYHVP